MEYVVLVDDQDNEIGSMEKHQAHRQARLHRAISVFIFNSKGELLLQQRAKTKYHSGNLWTNTCCSHPRPNEKVEDAAIRRLYEEMGLVCTLEKVFSFTYKAELDNDLTEYELDHVFIGTTDALPEPDVTEVAAWKYSNFETLEENIASNPNQYTEWFKICLKNWHHELFNNSIKQ